MNFTAGNIMAQLKDITLFLLDMDGTVNLGYDPIDGAKEFLETLKAQGKNFIFLTNNSSKNAFDDVEKMRSLGFPCESENVFTSGMAAGMFLQENKKDSLVYVCGTESLKKELKNYNVNISEDGVGADTVLLGYDTEVDYKKIRVVCDLLDAGADDFNVEDDCYEIMTSPEGFSATRDALDKAGYTFVQAEINYIPQTTTALENEEDIKKMEKLIDMLEENDDVQNVYHTWEMPDEEE